MTTYRITAATIKNYKKIREVTITPDADSAVVLIAGKNASGKSSVLEALSVALGGKKHQLAEPVRHGAEQAEIFVELDSDVGAIRIERVIQPNGESVVKVRGRDGQITAPQKLLDGIIGARFLDPIAFLNIPAKEQREQLLQIIDADKQIQTLDSKRESHFDKRTEIGRDLKNAKGEFERLPPEVEVPIEVDIAALVAEQNAITAVRTAHAESMSAHRAAAAITTAAIARRDNGRAESERIQAQLAELTARLAKFEAEEANNDTGIFDAQNVEDAARAKLEVAAERAAASAKRADQIESDMRGASDANRRIVEVNFANKRRKEAEDTITRMTKSYDDESAWIEKIDRRKAGILATAKLPVPGLGYDANGVTMNGHPFAQASGAEKIRVALGIAIAASPNLDDIWIRDGALMDEDSMALAIDLAEVNGKRLWCEVVRRQDGAIVISDGVVVE